MKARKSWSQPRELDSLIGRKKVDWSIFVQGTTVPVELHEDFDIANGGRHVERGTQVPVSLVINGTVFDAVLRNVDRKRFTTDTYQIWYPENRELQELLTTTFGASLEYITAERQRRAPSGSKVYVNIPDDRAEYMDFYRTSTAFMYRVELLPL